MRDVTGREIRSGDLVRVFHFTGARKKKHYMYFLIFEHEGHMRAAHTHIIPEQGLRVERSISLSVVLSGHPDATIIDGYACKDGEASFEDRPRA